MNYRKKYRLISEISLELDDWKSVPDLAIFEKMEIDFIHDEIKMTNIPLAIIEILPPTQGIQELNDKAERYFFYGVKSAWLVIPSTRTIAIYHSPYEFQLFTQGIARDNVLDLEVDLKEVFS
jgi:Uma2 family endonuclease